MPDPLENALNPKPAQNPVNPAKLFQAMQRVMPKGGMKPIQLPLPAGRTMPQEMLKEHQMNPNLDPQNSAELWKAQKNADAAFKLQQVIPRGAIGQGIMNQARMKKALPVKRVGLPGMPIPVKLPEIPPESFPNWK